METGKRKGWDDGVIERKEKAADDAGEAVVAEDARWTGDDYRYTCDRAVMGPQAIRTNYLGPGSGAEIASWVEPKMSTSSRYDDAWKKDYDMDLDGKTDSREFLPQGPCSEYQADVLGV